MSLPLITVFLWQEHMDEDAIRERMQTDKMNENTVFILYDVEITPSKEIEQLGAVASTGGTFSTFISTTTWKNSSPILKKNSPNLQHDCGICHAGNDRSEAVGEVDRSSESRQGHDRE